MGQGAELSKLTAQPSKVKIGDREVIVSPLDIDDMAAVEAWVRENRVTAFVRAANKVKLDPAVWAKTLVELTARPVSQEETQAETSSMAGVRFLLWRMMQKHDPSIKLEKMGVLIGSKNLEDANTIIGTYSGMFEPDDKDKDKKDGEEAQDPPAMEPEEGPKIPENPANGNGA